MVGSTNEILEFSVTLNDDSLPLAKIHVEFCCSTLHSDNPPIMMKKSVAGR